MTSTAYKQYKNTNHAWIEATPAHWKTGRVKDFVETNAAVKVPADLAEDALVEFVPMTNVNDELGQITEFNFVPYRDVSTGYTKFKNKDVIFAKITPCMENGNSAVVNGLCKNIGFGSTEFIVFRAKSKLGEKYLHYFFHNDLFLKNAEPFMKGTAGQKRISSQFMATHFFALPPLNEQFSIVSYLDKKTSRIDLNIGLLNKKAKQYEKLKQSLINETVTRGLDKTVAMKDSGVEWIEEVPTHWNVCRVAEIAKQNKVKNIGLVEKNLLSLSYGRIIRKDLNTNFGLLPESFETYQIVKNGAIILRLTDLQNDQKSLRVGHVGENGIITSAYLGLNFNKKIHSKFAYYLLHVYDLCKVFYWFGGGLRSTMRYEDVKIIPFVVPPSHEQQAIVDFLDEKTAKIDQIVITINDQIEKLKELRKTLISDVVTGKIKVTQDDNGEGLAA